MAFRLQGASELHGVRAGAGDDAPEAAVAGHVEQDRAKPRRPRTMSIHGRRGWMVRRSSAIIGAAHGRSTCRPGIGGGRPREPRPLPRPGGGGGVPVGACDPRSARVRGECGRQVEGEGAAATDLAAPPPARRPAGWRSRADGEPEAGAAILPVVPPSACWKASKTICCCLAPGCRCHGRSRRWRALVGFLQRDRPAPCGRRRPTRSVTLPCSVNLRALRAGLRTPAAVACRRWTATACARGSISTPSCRPFSSRVAEGALDYSRSSATRTSSTLRAMVPARSWRGQDLVYHDSRSRPTGEWSARSSLLVGEVAVGVVESWREMMSRLLSGVRARATYCEELRLVL